MDKPTRQCTAPTKNSCDAVTSDTVTPDNGAMVPAQSIKQVEASKVPSSLQHSQSLHGGASTVPVKADGGIMIELCIPYKGKPMVDAKNTNKMQKRRKRD